MDNESERELLGYVLQWLQSQADQWIFSFSESDFLAKISDILDQEMPPMDQSYELLEECWNYSIRQLRTLGVFTETSRTGFHKLSKRRLVEVREKFSQLAVSKKKAPRKYVKKSEAEQIAKKKYEQLWRIDNKSEWAREIGCDRTTVPKLEAWHRAEKRRQNWRRVANKLEGTVDPAIIEALHTGDASVLASLSEKDRDNLDGLTDANRAEMIELLNEAARDDVY